MNPEFHQQRLNRIGATANTLAALCEVSSATTSKYFSGSIGNSTSNLERKIDQVLTQMEKLQAACYPIPVEWSRVTAVKEILEDFTNGHIHVSVVKSKPQGLPYCVRLSTGSGYYARNNKQEITSVLNQFQSTVMTETVANAVVNLLKAKGYKTAHKTPCVQADLDLICLNIGDAWPEPVTA